MADYNVTVGVDVDESKLKELDARLQAFQKQTIGVDVSLNDAKKEFNEIKKIASSAGVDIPVNLQSINTRQMNNLRSETSKIAKTMVEAYSKGFDAKTLFGTGNLQSSVMERQLAQAEKVKDTYSKYLQRFNIDATKVDWSAGIDSGVQQATKLLQDYGKQVGVVFDSITNDAMRFHEKFDANTEMFTTYTAAGKESFDGLRGSVEKFSSSGSEALDKFSSKLQGTESATLFDALNKAISETGIKLDSAGNDWGNIIKNISYTTNAAGEVTSARLHGVVDNLKINVNMLRDAETGLLKATSSTQTLDVETEADKQAAKLKELQEAYKTMLNLKKELADSRNEDSSHEIQQRITAQQQLINSIRAQITDQEQLKSVTQEYSDTLQKQIDTTAFKQREEEVKNLTNAMKEMEQMQSKIATLTGKEDFNTNQIDEYKNRIQELIQEFPQLANAYDAATNTLKLDNIANPFEKGTVAAKKFEEAVKQVQTASNMVAAKQKDTQFKQQYNKATEALKKFIAARKELATAESSGKASDKYIEALNRQLKEAQQELVKAREELRSFNNEAGNIKFDNTIRSSMSELNTDLSKIRNSTKETTTSVNEMGSGFSTAFSGMAQFAAILGIFDGVQQAISGAKEEIIELNTAMTELQIVTETSASTMQTTMAGYADMAKELGVTLQTVAEGAGEWLNVLVTINPLNCWKILKISILY